MHILMVSDVYYPRVNGVSTSIKTFRESLSGLGVRSTLIAPSYTKINRVEYDENEDLLRVPARGVMFDPEDRILSRRKQYIAQILEITKTHKYDLVHIQTPFVAHYLGKQLSRHFDIPVIETYHTFFEEYFYHYIPFVPKPWLRFTARWFSRTQCNRLDALVVPSSAMFEKLQEYGIKTEMAIIPTGVEMPKTPADKKQNFLEKYHIPAGRPIMLHVGRIAFEKNIGFLLDMYHEVKKVLPDVILLIAGEGPAKNSLQKKARQLGVADGVYFIGYLDRENELLDCYKSGDVFVFASRTETQGLVLLEAMALGLPVVSTAEMGTKDILMPQQGAIIANEELKDFSVKVISLLTDTEKRKRLSHEAMAYAATWSPGNMAEKMRVFYRRLIESHAALAVSGSQEKEELVTDDV